MNDQLVPGGAHKTPSELKPPRGARGWFAARLAGRVFGRVLARVAVRNTRPASGAANHARAPRGACASGAACVRVRSVFTRIALSLIVAGGVGGCTFGYGRGGSGE